MDTHPGLQRQTTSERVAEWYATRRWHWPLLPIVWLGLLAAPYMTLVGAGQRDAAAALPSSEAALTALNRQPIPVDQNAATAWRLAFAAFVEEQPTREEREGAGWRGWSLDWSAPATYDADGTARRFVADNAATTELVRAAAATSACNWEMDYGRGFRGELRPRALSAGTGGLETYRAKLAIHDGRWNDVLEALEHVLVMRRHTATDSLDVCHLVALAIEGLAQEIVASALAAPSIPAPVLTRLDELAGELRDAPIPIAASMATVAGCGSMYLSLFARVLYMPTMIGVVVAVLLAAVLTLPAYLLARRVRRRAREILDARTGQGSCER